MIAAYAAVALALPLYMGGALALMLKPTHAATAYIGKHRKAH